MTGYESKRVMAQDKLEQAKEILLQYPQKDIDWQREQQIKAHTKLDDDDIQVYKREWVGLTDEEAQWLYDNCRTPSNLIDMVEAKLKEKNT